MTTNHQSHTEDNMQNAPASTGQVDLSQKVFGAIEKEHIEPRAKWQFVLKDCALWLVWLISLTIGAAAIAGMLFELMNAGWQFYAATHDSFFEFVLDSLPVLWGALLALFILIAYQDVRKTRRGYRYSIIAIVGISIAVSIIGGVFLYVFGFGQIFDERFGNRIPFHRPVVVRMQESWQRPERGLLGGEVLMVSTTSDTFILKDFNGMQWTVSSIDLSEIDRDILERFSVVRVVGVPLDVTLGTSTEFIFHACLIAPWEVQGRAAAMAPSERVQRLTVFRGEMQGERNIDAVRSTECETVRPYRALDELRNGAAQ